MYICMYVCLYVCHTHTCTHTHTHTCMYKYTQQTCDYPCGVYLVFILFMLAIYILLLARK